MRRIGLFLAVEPNAGGMFQYSMGLLDALRALDRTVWAVEVACLSPTWATILADYRFGLHRLWMGRAGVRMSNLLMAGRVPAGLARAVSSLTNPVVWQLRRIGCDAWIFPAQDTLTFHLDQPAIGTIHDLMHRYEPHFPEVAGSGRVAMRDHRFHNIAHRSRAIFVDSEIGRAQVVESYGVDPSRIFPLPYVAPHYVAAPEPADFDARYPLPPKFVFYPAQFWAHKNHRALIEAAATIKVRHPDVALVFTGSKAHDCEALRDFAAARGLAGAVHFPGYVPNDYLSGFYRRARAMMMPTLFGPTNIPPLEAFVCGCACAVSDIYAMPEQTRGAALLFDPRSVVSVAEAMERLWSDDDLVARLTAAGHAIAQEWGQPQFNARFAEIIATVMGHSEAGGPVRSAGEP